MHRPDDPTSLASNIVHCLYEYKINDKDLLWIGTNNGLSFINLDQVEKGAFGYPAQNDEFPSRVIYGILADGKDNLWLSTNKGIIKFNLQTKHIRSYTAVDGLQSDEFNASSCLKTRNGRFLFGGVNGFNMFFPDSIKDNHFQPPVVITSFKVFDKSLNIGRTNSRKGLTLKYDQNFLSFEFTALDFSKPGKNQYAYKLEGFDKEWIYCGSRRYVSYTNLDPGEYIFKVKGTNGDGIWNNRPASVFIQIKPPFWQTWWFRLLAGVFFLLIFYGLYKYRITKLLEIERLRVRIASDLHDDIGSALTRISVYSETIQISKEQSKIRDMSRKIGAVSREIISTMSDVVWSIDARNDSVKNLIDRMRDFAANMLSEKDIQFVFNHKGLNPDKKISVDTRQNLFLIFKEAITNIVKHSAATRVKVELLNTKTAFRMSISDNGTGFNSEEATTGNGIKNIRMRAKRIGAEINFEADKGARLSLKMKNI